MKANTILAAALLSLSCASADAQSAITYTYDAAGNRILREPARNREGGAFSDSLSTEQRMTRFEITVSPNPTRGLVTVSLSGIDEESSCMLSLFDAVGKQLHSFIMTGRTATLDLSP